MEGVGWGYEICCVLTGRLDELKTAVLAVFPQNHNSYTVNTHTCLDFLVRIVY